MLLDAKKKFEPGLINFSQFALITTIISPVSGKLLMDPLAIPLGCQRTTAKWLVMAGHIHTSC